MTTCKNTLLTVENGILVISCDETYFINTEVMKVTVKMPVIGATRSQ
jgi:hypothetical protein